MTMHLQTIETLEDVLYENVHYYVTIDNSELIDLTHLSYDPRVYAVYNKITKIREYEGFCLPLAISKAILYDNALTELVETDKQPLPAHFEELLHTNFNKH